MRIAVNGMGRIGKNFIRALLSDKQALQKISLVAINVGPAPQESLALLFKYDSIMGTYKGEVTFEHDILTIDGHAIKIFAQKDALELPWQELAIDWVVDCSGKYTHRQDAQKHLQAGASKVLISAPAHGDDITIIPGVNDPAYDPQKHSIVSLGSCTTNAVVPMLKVLHDTYGIQNALMTTVHAYTNSQMLLDGVADDPRRARAAALNCIPTSTGASKMVGKVLPELASKIQGVALRVPLATVSLIDLVVQLDKQTDTEKINNTFRAAAQSSALQGILTTTNEPLVSSDFQGNSSSVIVDETLTVVQGNLAKVFGWYDNEWGYSQRLKDFLMGIV